MTSGLGLKVGSTTSVAVSTVPLSGSEASHPSAEVSTSPDEYSSFVGRSALDLAPGRAPALASATSGGVTGFAGRVGDPVALISDDGRSFTGDELYATALECLATETAVGEDRTIVVAYPTHWRNYTVEALRDAAADRGLTDLSFVPEALTSVAWLGRTRDVPDDGLVVVYDLGGSALDVTLVRTGADSSIVGNTVRSEDVSGAHFDHLVMQHVLGGTGWDLDTIDPFDPATEADLAVVRERCSEAKEALSTDTDTVVSVHLSAQDADVRLVRSELEDLFREPLLASFDVVDEAIRSAGVDPREVTTVLLTGGGASVPLVAELASSRLRVPVVSDRVPALTSAVGAAVLAVEISSAAAEVESATASAHTGAFTAAASTSLVPVGERSLVTRPPRSSTAVTKTTTRGRRLAIIGAIAAAIAVLAAGGLGVGTALTSNNEDAGSTTSSPPTSADAAPSADVSPTVDGAVPAAGVVAGQTDSSGNAATVPPGASTDSTGGTQQQAPAGQSPAQQAPAGQSAAQQVPAQQAPAQQAPVQQVPAQQAPQLPAYQPPTVQIPSNPIQIPSNPLGGVTSGLGNTLGGVTGGLGNAVGGLTNPILGGG